MSTSWSERVADPLEERVSDRSRAARSRSVRQQRLEVRKALEQLGEPVADDPLGGTPRCRTIRFFPDYSASHPLWFWFDYPHLAALRLPADLADRLQRWSAYWDSTFHWDDGWPAGTPGQWWADEEARLPRDVAIALGSDFVIEVSGRYVHSAGPADSPASAAAVHALVDAEAAERQRIQADLASGATYDFVAGGTSFRAWLAAQKPDGTPPR